MEAASSLISEADQKRIQELHQKLELGDQKLPLIASQQAVLIFGKSNIGKTTLMHMIVGTKLKVAMINGMPVIAIDDTADNDAKQAALGHDGTSCTITPNKFVMKVAVNGQTMTIVDLPGFMDVSNFAGRIANCYYIYTTFLNVPQNKFILAMTEGDLFVGQASSAIETIQLFLNHFLIAPNGQATSDTQVSIADLASKTILVINKAHNRANLMAKLKQVANIKNGTPVGQFLQTFINDPEKKIQIIDEVQENQPVPNIQISQKLTQIGYISRTRPDKSVNMGYIHYKLSEREIGPDMPLVQAAFGKNKEDIEKCWDCLRLAISEILTNFTKQDFEYTFPNNWESKINQVTKLTKLDYKLIQPKSYPHFSTLKLVQQLYKINLPEVLTVEIMQNNALSIIRQISKLLPLNQDQFNTIKRMSYAINRKYQETKVLQKIREDYNFDNLNCKTSFQGCFTQLLPAVQERMANDLIIQGGKEGTYYSEAAALLSRFKEKNTVILNKMGACERFKGQLMEKEKKWLEAFEAYLNALELSNEFNKQKNATHFIELDEILVRKIAELLFRSNRFKLASYFYKMIGDFTNVQNCYQKLITLKKSNDEEYNLRIELGDYYCELTLEGEAKIAYLMARNSVTDVAKKLEAQKKFSSVQNLIQANTTLQQNKATAGELWTQLPAGQTRDTILTELKQNKEAIYGTLNAKLEDSDLTVNIQPKK